MDSLRTEKSIGAPRGLLRFLVLVMLDEKPMSGAEISDQIEKQTGGRWKPSSGSIYPLLAWMVKRGLTVETPRDVAGLKRYAFTEKGKKYFKKQIIIAQDFLNKIEFLLPFLIGGIQFGSNKEKFLGAIEPTRQMIKAFTSIRLNFDRLLEKDIEDIIHVLTDCSIKLEKIARKSGDEHRTIKLEYKN